MQSPFLEFKLLSPTPLEFCTMFGAQIWFERQPAGFKLSSCSFAVKDSTAEPKQPNLTQTWNVVFPVFEQSFKTFQNVKFRLNQNRRKFFPGFPKIFIERVFEKKKNFLGRSWIFFFIRLKSLNFRFCSENIGFQWKLRNFSKKTISVVSRGSIF